MSFLFTIFIIIIVVVLIVISVAVNLLRSILGFGRKRSRFSQHHGDQQHQPTAHKKKIFEKSEGEYVDFEEIK